VRRGPGPSSAVAAVARLRSAPGRRQRPDRDQGHYGEEIGAGAGRPGRPAPTSILSTCPAVPVPAREVLPPAAGGTGAAARELWNGSVNGQDHVWTP